MSECRICAGINPDISNVANGKLLGVAEATIRRHKGTPHLEGIDAFFDIPETIITSRGASIRTAYGWEKVTYRPAAAAFTEAVAFKDIETVFDGWDFTAYVSTDKDEREILVVSVADPQTGKTGSGGDTQDLVSRTMSCYQKIAHYASARHFAQIIFVDAGDVIENFTNVVAQEQTNDLSLTDQVRVAYKLLLYGIKMLAPLTTSFVYVAVPSNHASVRKSVGDKNRANFPGDDYGLLIQDLIALYAEDRADMAHIQFVKPGKYDETVTFMTLDGTILAFTHGHVANSQEQLPQWFSNQIAGRTVPGIENASILITGHFHSAYLAEAADGRLVIGSPTLDNGSDYFRNAKGKSNKPGMLTFKVDDGEMNGWRIWRP